MFLICSIKSSNAAAREWWLYFKTDLEQSSSVRLGAGPEGSLSYTIDYYILLYRNWSKTEEKKNIYRFWLTEIGN